MNHLLFWEQGRWWSDVRSVVFLLHWNVPADVLGKPCPHSCYLPPFPTSTLLRSARGILLTNESSHVTPNPNPSFRPADSLLLIPSPSPHPLPILQPRWLQPTPFPPTLLPDLIKKHIHTHCQGQNPLEHISVSCCFGWNRVGFFGIHSATLCLSIEAFSPFIFKLIIERNVFYCYFVHCFWVVFIVFPFFSFYSLLLESDEYL